MLKSVVFASQPLIRFTERHGGPLWYHVDMVLFEFYKNQDLKITVDSRLTKAMIPLDLAPKIMMATYRTHDDAQGKKISILEAKFGTVNLADGTSFNFEKIPSNSDYLFIEDPPFWKESFVLALKKK